jgi:hypothetical protein
MTGKRELTIEFFSGSYITLCEALGCTGEDSSECRSTGILICKMPTSMHAVTCNIYYR